MLTFHFFFVTGNFQTWRGDNYFSREQFFDTVSYYFELKRKNTDTGNDTKTLIPGKPTKQERGTQTPYQNVKQDKNSFSNEGKIALERFVIATLYSSTLYCQTS